MIKDSNKKIATLTVVTYNNSRLQSIKFSENLIILLISLLVTSPRLLILSKGFLVKKIKGVEHED